MLIFAGNTFFDAGDVRFACCNDRQTFDSAKNPTGTISVLTIALKGDRYAGSDDHNEIEIRGSRAAEVLHALKAYAETRSFATPTSDTGEAIHSYTAGLTTQNEARERIGLGPIQGGDTYYPLSGRT